jgi:hypothetical protein
MFTHMALPLPVPPLVPECHTVSCGMVDPKLHPADTAHDGDWNNKEKTTVIPIP